jgi:hypothetical protein
VADSQLIFYRGENLYQHGSYFLSESDEQTRCFVYEMDGNYGDYVTRIQLTSKGLETVCDCPYPGTGCKHVVAAALNVRDLLQKSEHPASAVPETATPYLSREEIRDQALADRRKRAGSEKFTLMPGDMLKGDHLVENQRHRQYQVCFHDPAKGVGHCTCPDYLTSGLGTCKHLLFAQDRLKKTKGFDQKLKKERFAFTDIFWNSRDNGPAFFSERLSTNHADLVPILSRYFDLDTGAYRDSDLSLVLSFMDQVAGDKRVRIRENLLQRVEDHVQKQEANKRSARDLPALPLKMDLYPFQKEGVRFGLYKTGVLIGDEMGLGKTLQAIGLCVLKKEIFGFSKVLVVTLASLKEQWKREIEKFSHEQARVVEGTPQQREALYRQDKSLFKVTNYEAVLRDVTILSRFNPDIIVLDEAQRIKNFSTKTADAVKQIPKRHGIVLTGTPLENKLEDVYSIVQFLDPFLLTPLWAFAADHFLIPKTKKTSIAGYQNLEKLKERLRGIVIRRKKQAVLKDLPDVVENNYYIELTDEQKEMHAGYARSLLPLVNKKFLTPMDLRKIQMLLLRMRQVCDSTYLIDRNSHISPKLKELEGIIDELVIQNQRKIVIFSEWTTMTYLVARQLSDMEIPFIELSGKVAVKKRQALIDEFTHNPDCRVFLSTDAGGTGLNLQAADCVINFELPWNPAKMNQRIGRVSRIGQQSGCVNVINLVAKHSIEERILTGIQIKTDLFKGVFDDGPDAVEFSREKRNELLNRLREMMGEETMDLPGTPLETEEIPEDTPHFLNPGVLNREMDDRVSAESDDTVKLSDPDEVSEDEQSEIGEANETGDPSPDQTVQKTPAHARTHPGDRVAAAATQAESDPENFMAGQSSERIETVLNSGMAFISGLMEMATGRKVQTPAADEKMVRINRETGEVTMSFKLPGWR